eukprot:4057302-Amphidinium_carterae.3
MPPDPYSPPPPGTLYLDVGHMHTADSNGSKHFVSATVRLSDSSGKTMVLPWFVSNANRTEVVKVYRIVSSLSALRPLMPKALRAMQTQLGRSLGVQKNT